MSSRDVAAARLGRALTAVMAAIVAVAGVALSGVGAGAAGSPPPGPGKPPGPPPPHVQPAPGPAEVTIPVPEYRQRHALSCEESALSMVLAFEGRPPASSSDADQKAREDEILAYIGMDRTHWWAGAGSTETAAQHAAAGDPFASYVGDVDGSERTGVQTGYGTYSPTIARAATHFGAPVALAGSDISAETVYALLQAGRPAEVWLSYDLQPHARDDYTASDGRAIPYAGPWEHTMVLTGIDANGVRVNDPDRTQYWISFPQFESAFAVYGNMAVLFA